MKIKSLLIVTALFSAISLQAQNIVGSVQILNTNITSKGLYLIDTNRMNLLSIALVSPNNNTVVEFFDQITNAPYNGTNVVIPAYTSRAYAQSNLVTQFIAPDTGFTNWFTNSGIFTYMVTNAAATNSMTPALVLIGDNIVHTYSVNVLAENGLTIRTSTNANIVLYYNRGR